MQSVLPSPPMLLTLSGHECPRRPEFTRVFGGSPSEGNVEPRGGNAVDAGVHGPTPSPPSSPRLGGLSKWLLWRRQKHVLASSK